VNPGFLQITFLYHRHTASRLASCYKSPFPVPSHVSTLLESPYFHLHSPPVLAGETEQMLWLVSESILPGIFYCILYFNLAIYKSFFLNKIPPFCPVCSMYAQMSTGLWTG